MATLPEPLITTVLPLKLSPFVRRSISADKVAQAVAGGLRARQGTAVGQALAGQHARKLIGQTLILAEHIADLTRADADVARGHVGIRADMLGQLGHKGLAETHNFHIALALGVEVRAAFAAAHRQAGERCS